MKNMLKKVILFYLVFHCSFSTLPVYSLATNQIQLPESLEGIADQLLGSFQPEGDESLGFAQETILPPGVHLPPLKEIEPNNTLEEAQSLPFGRDLEGFLKEEDVDVYEVEIVDPAHIYITMAFPSGSHGPGIKVVLTTTTGQEISTHRIVYPYYERVSVGYYLWAGKYFLIIGPMLHQKEGFVSPPYAVYIERY